MNHKKLKLEIFYLRKSFFEYHRGFAYLYRRYIFAKTILKSNQVFGRPADRNDFSIHLLTCHRDLVMTIWSLASFYKVMPVRGQLFIHNDGSLTAGDKNCLKKYFSAALLVEPAEVDNLLEQKLGSRPDVIKIRRESKDLILLKKLIDPLVISDKQYKLVIDPDLAWFEQPLALAQAIREKADISLMMANNALCPVYFKDGISSDQLASFNSGIVFYSSKNFNLAKLAEYFGRIDLNDKRNNHFIEQAGFAYCLERLEKLPEKAYVIKEKLGPGVAVKHYTSPRRPLFYIEALKILQEIINV